MRKYSSAISVVIAVILCIVCIVAGIWYSVWQFQLCYPEVSSSFFYCWQHAFGN